MPASKSPVGFPSSDPHWDCYGTSFVVKDVQLKDGNFYDIRVERSDTLMPEGFAFACDDLLEMHMKFRGAFGLLPDPTRFAIISQDDACIAQPLGEGERIDYSSNREMRSCVKRVNEITAPLFRSMSSSGPIRMIRADHYFSPSPEKSSPPKDASTTLSSEPKKAAPLAAAPAPLPEEEEEESDVDADYDLSSLEDEEEPGSARPPAIPADFEDPDDPPGVSEPRAARNASNIFGDLDEDEAVPLAPGLRSASPVVGSVPAAPSREEEEEHLIPILDQVEPFGGYSRFRELAIDNPAYQVLENILRDPSASDKESEAVKKQLRKWIDAAYTRYFISSRINRSEKPENQSLDQYRIELAARWVIAGLLKSPAQIDINPLVRKLCSPAQVPAPAPSLWRNPLAWASRHLFGSGALQ